MDADGSKGQLVLPQHPNHGVQVQQYGGTSRRWRRHHRAAAVRAARGCGVPEAEEANQFLRLGEGNGGGAHLRIPPTDDQLSLLEAKPLLLSSPVRPRTVGH